MKCSRRTRRTICSLELVPVSLVPAEIVPVKRSITTISELVSVFGVSILHVWINFVLALVRYVHELGYSLIHLLGKHKVGFDSHDPHHNAVEQIVIQPAKFASYATDVYDPLLGPPKRPNPCLKVTCGDRAHCSNVYNYNAGKEEGQCFCRDGAYPDPQRPTDCALKTTKNGCRCMQRWTSWGLSYYGCSWNGECKVDRHHNSFHSCRARNNADDIWVSRTSNLVFETDKEYDSCRFESSPQKVLAVRIAP